MLIFVNYYETCAVNDHLVTFHKNKNDAINAAINELETYEPKEGYLHTYEHNPLTNETIEYDFSTDIEDRCDDLNAIIEREIVDLGREQSFLEWRTI